jgi:hypothetical protein
MASPPSAGLNIHNVSVCIKIIIYLFAKKGVKISDSEIKILVKMKNKNCIV